MIKTPVSYDERFDYLVESDGGYIAYDIHQEVANEVVKRINMHDELLEAVMELKSFYDDRICSTQETMLSKEIDNLLERCK